MIASQNLEELPISDNSKKKRLATTRGFGNLSSIGGVLPSEIASFITPQSSPTKFVPVAKSTPIPGEVQVITPDPTVPAPLPSKSAVKKVYLPPIPPYSPTRRRKLLPPRPPSPFISAIGRLSGITSIGVNVISPTPTPQPSLASAEQSLDWDNFADSASYQTIGDLNLQGLQLSDCLAGIGLDQTRTIPIVNTSESSLSVSSFTREMSVFSHQTPDQMDSNTRAQVQQQMNQKSNLIYQLNQEFEDMLEDFCEDDVNRGNLLYVKDKLDGIADARSKVRNAVRDYQSLFGSFGDQSGTLTVLITTNNQKVRTHANSIWERVEELQHDQQVLVPLDQPAHQQGHQAVSQGSTNSSQVAAATARQLEGRLSYEAKKMEFKDQVRLLKDSLNLPDFETISDHWNKQSNSEVCKTIRKMADWDKSLVRISKTFREYEKLSKQFNEDATDREAVLDDYIDVRNNVKEVGIAVQFEDDDRNLQTLQPSKSEKVKYPSFSGEPGEDLVKFKLKMAECFQKNQVPKSDQLDKLRENLTGAALKRVPDTVKELSVAWQNLNEAFGSPIVVLKERLKSLTKVGSIPPDTAASKQITWYHDFESVMQDIIDLGTTDDMNMQMGAFGPPVQEQVLKALNDNPYIKKKVAMAGSGKQPKEKMKAFRDKIVELRRETQLAEIESGTADKKPSKVAGAGAGNSAHVTPFVPTKHEECRICVHLEATGKSSNFVLYEKHLGKKPVGCPNFMKVQSKTRRSLMIGVKLCQFCLDDEIVYTVQHGKDCSASKKKTKASFTCQAPGCAKHFWVCPDHEEDNKEKFENANRKLSKHGLQVSHLIICMTANLSSETSSAMERLAGQVEKELLPVPEGEPMFLFFGAKGRTREIMTFFDSGCSKYVIKDEVISSKELPATLVKNGPIFLGGVGNTRVFASGEYMVAMDRDERRAQTFQGLAVDVITGNFPKMDLSSAVAAVKMDNQRNKYLQNCKFPKIVGGSVDVLIGIQYNTCQPKLVHMMPSGLAIYETNLMPNSKNMRFVLGGPHSSFDVLLSRYPDANLLMQNFSEGIAKWKSLGPPSLTQYVMSDHEIDQACERNLSNEEMDSFMDLLQVEQLEVIEEIQQLNKLSTSGINQSYQTAAEQLCDHPHHGLADHVCLVEQSGSLGDSTYQHEISHRVECCEDCGTDLPAEYIAALETDRLSQLKQIVDHQEAGLDISYRCVRCRNCVDCKNAEKVDKISLREEAELCEIRSSLDLNWKEKKIICKLPLRGPERDFLTSNQDRALKILDSQCRKYYNDEETKTSIVAAFKKLFDRGYFKLLDDIPEDTKKKFMNKEVQYFLPWRIQFKPGSASTPARPVFDASSGTRRRQDGSGGRCLNDLVCKGPIDTLDLMKVTLRFMIGSCALVADLTKMYNQFHLEPEYWNLQRILFKEGLDPQAPVQQAVVSTLIYGVKSTSCQSETGLDDIGDHVKDEKPEVNKLLKDGRYVDNLLESKKNIEEARALGEATTEVLDRLSLTTKGFTYSGEDPQPDETIDGVSMDINGYRWFSKLDIIEPKVPPLHFGKKCRGRVVGAEYFEAGGGLAKMDAHVPIKLTRRMIVSKRASLYESMGKLEPIKAKLKIDEREAVMLTSNWDDAVPSNIRNKWIQNFLLIEQMRGLRYTRARIPSTALDTIMRLITLVDAAEKIVMVVTYCGFRVQGGGWSCQQLIGRSALGTGTIPRNELQGLTGGSNLSWIVRKALHDWVDTSILAGDSEIALHWNISDTRKLGIWHRNRVIQIRRGTELDNLYHVGTDHNVADVGTRADKVCIEDVGPNSRYENGDPWMRLELDQAVQQGFLKPALDLKPSQVESKDEFKKGFIFEKEPEVLTRGHLADENPEQLESKRVEKIAERAAFSNYDMLLPTRRSFPAMVRITSYVLIFINKCRSRVNRRLGSNKTWSGTLLLEASIWFSAFPTTTQKEALDCHTMVQVAWVHTELAEIGKTPLMEAFSVQSLAEDDLYYKAHTTSVTLQPTDSHINAALLLYFRMASREVTQFNSKQLIDRQTVMKDGILLSKGRIIDGMNFMETADLDTLNLGNLGVKTMIPVIDRFSPLAYSIAQHFHWTVVKHRGMETCLRFSLEHVHILQGMSLFRELSNECIRCKIRRGNFIKAATGPLGEKQLIVAPPFYACQIDLFGPVRTFVPGYEKETRATKVKESKVWILTSVCIVTSNVNLQVLEMKDTAAILEGFIRLSCESGYPKYVFCDQEASILKVLREIQVNLRDLSHRLYSEQGILFDTCAVGGHDQHGKVERTIRSVQDSLGELGLDKMRIHSMGIQTLCKQVENSYNNLPLGYRYDRGQDNTEVLKLLVPNMLRMGKINSRALDGPVKLSSDNKKMLSEIQKKYEAWYKIWVEVYVPKLMARKSHFKNSRDLAPDDIVYYQKDESALSSPWIMGIIDQVVRGRDGIIRRVIVRYRNFKEDFDRFTDRSVRRLIKIYSVDDPDLQQDLTKVQARIDELLGIGGHADAAASIMEVFGDAIAKGHAQLFALTKSTILQGKCQCCCKAHCKVSIHNYSGNKTFYQAIPSMEDQLISLVSREYMQEGDMEEVEVCDTDNFTAFIMSVGLNLS